MDTTVSPRIRVLALAGLIAAVGLAASFFLLSRAQSQAATELPPPAAPAPTPQAVAAKPKPAAKAKARPAAVVAANGLPLAVARALRGHRLVVVSVYAGGAAIDTLARDEARAGARDAKAGFAAVDVSDRRLALALASRTDSLSAPALLVFDRSAAVVARLDGFADRTLVAGLVPTAR